jgi:ectoine hydroxylase-related dioxygenase (phytanoyl-CoA dioxygenase family)
MATVEFMDKVVPSNGRGNQAAIDRVTPDLVEQWERDGALWIPGLLSPAWLALIAQGIQRNLTSPGPNAETRYAGQPGEFYDDFCNYPAIPEYQRLLEDSPLVDVIAKLLNTERLWLFYDQIFLKEGGYSRATPWHQDIPYFCGNGRQFADAWISLEPLTEDETLEVVAGSCNGPVYNGVRAGKPGLDLEDDDKSAFVDKEDIYPPIPDIDNERDKWPIISWASQPGDVLIFHPATLHGGAAMREGGRRRTLSVRFFGDDVVYVERPGMRVAPPFPGVSEALSPGDPLRHPWFPQLLPRSAKA